MGVKFSFDFMDITLTIFNKQEMSSSFYIPIVHTLDINTKLIDINKDGKISQAIMASIVVKICLINCVVVCCFAGH